MNGYKEHREKFQNKMKNLLQDSPYNVSTLADIKLYKTIEKRGFFVRFKRAKISEHDLNEYALRSMTNRNTLDWVIISYGKNKNIGKGQEGIQQA